ncbi:MAG: glucosaminidase domain-containing protein [Bacteroidales bacterium]|nr:glucosaminidase domain-containing protein [Bacteroidales bacterium]
MKKLFLLLSLLFPLVLTAQRITPEEYIQTYKDIAMREMRDHKIPASITLAQGLLESGAGNSALAREAKNHFGIKCHKGWEGDTYIMDDDEKNECFRKYDNAEESFVDHSLFLTTRSRYAALFDLDITDYEGWARGLKAAGYATNPKYAQLLIDRIKLYDLAKYDEIALGERSDDNQLPDIEPEDELLELAYSPDNRSAFELVDMTADKRFIYENNGVRFVFAKEGETPERLAKEFGVKYQRFCEYNLLRHPDEMVFHSGDVVYLEKLSNKNWKAKKHAVGEGETLRDIALRFAVKPEKILKKNGLAKDARVLKGQVLWLW